MNKSKNDVVLPKLSSFRKKRYLQVVKKLGYEELIPKLEKSIPFWYFMDFKYLGIEIVPRDFEIPPHTMREMEARFMSHIEQRTIEFDEFPREYSIFESCILFQKLFYAITYGFTEQSKVSLRFQNWISLYTSRNVSIKVAAELGRSMCSVLHYYSSIEHYVYGFTMEDVPVNPQNPSNTTARFAVIRQKPPTRKINVGSEIRTGIQIRTNRLMDQFQNRTVQWQGTIYDLYIQGHALRRMEERLDINPWFAHMLLAFDVEYTMVREYRGSLLIPVFEPNHGDGYIEAHEGNRIGYLIGTITDGVVLIRTFLFIAQDFTPEGDKLSQLLELKMIDKGYLKLDRLEYFTRSDLRDDETLRPIFNAARLDHLFKVKDDGKLPEYSGNAEFIREMLQLN